MQRLSTTSFKHHLVLRGHFSNFCLNTNPEPFSGIFYTTIFLTTKLSTIFYNLEDTEKCL